MRLLFLSLPLYIFFVLSGDQLNAQNIYVQDDFEGNGTITTWYGDDCGIDTSFSNPFPNGINTSATVLKYSDNGGQYANVRFDVANNFDLSQYHTFSLKIYIPSSGITGNQNNQVSLKLQDGTLGAPWSTQSEIIKNISPDQWQEISFNFANDPYINLDPNSLPPVQRNDFNRVVIQVNGENNYDHVLAYIDDVLYDGTIQGDPVYDNLVWNDEFDGNGMIDTSKWFHQTQLPQNGSWYNGEIQHYTDRIDNSEVSNGTLKIIAKKETYTDQGVTKQYTSARLNMKYAFTYGKVEVRAKLPSGAGTWPAIWTLGQNINEPGAYWQTQGYGTVSWPACGEIDIMEHWGSNQNYVQSAIHTPSSYGSTVNHGGQTIPTASTDFHVYSMVWSPDKIVFSVDGNTHYTYQPSVQDASTWPFDAPQFLIMNIAIIPGIDPNFVSSSMEIDYVRIYQESLVTINPLVEQPGFKLYPNPVSDKLFIQTGEKELNSYTLSIYNTRGQLIRQFNKAGEQSLISLDGLGTLDPGLYFIALTCSGKTFTQKFLKN